MSVVAFQPTFCESECDLLVRTNTMSVIIDRHSLILPVEMSMFPSPELPARLSSVSAVIVITSHQR